MSLGYDDEHDAIAEMMASGVNSSTIRGHHHRRGTRFRYDPSPPLSFQESQTSCAGCVTLTKEIDVLRINLVTLVSRIETLEETSQMFPMSEKGKGKSALRSLSPGGLGHINAPRPSNHFAATHQSTHVGAASLYADTRAESSRARAFPVSTSAAASLAIRLNKSTGNIRTAAAKASTSHTKASTSNTVSASSSSSASAIAFKDVVGLGDGTITLVKDRRLLDQPIASHTYSALFKDITERERLEASPVIGKDFSAKKVYETIVESFRRLDHDLIRDGQSGYEFCRLLNHSGRLQANSVDPPTISLTGVELAILYKRNKCFIVVRSTKKFKKYDPLLHQLFGTLVDDSSLPASDGSDEEENQSDVDSAWKKCDFCEELIGIKEHEDHETQCGEEWATQRALHKERAKKGVKQEADLVEHLPRNCACGEVDMDEMVGCDGSDCDVWCHRACIGVIDGFTTIEDDWFCSDTCLESAQPDKAASFPHAPDSAEPATSVSSNKRPGSTALGQRSSTRLKQHK
ncbi:hypothetical protein A4X13_0g8445 [Tilletia indica]|uniref:Zinc finger PHD-type domain-containing protein n=1 Tax=Tilletia indica TaxID=43049 RepID=A0A8T8SET9_9BASI|nr:hypothetical protein A4X13_0g8445 [Tilletia indica]